MTISPTYVLRFLKTLLRAETGVLIISTPNAVALTKRVRMVKGYNPFELIREEGERFGHRREYRMDELIRFGTRSGLKIDKKEFCDYWHARRLWIRLLEKAHPSFRQGITIAFLPQPDE